jgi:hypothetical protein
MAIAGILAAYFPSEDSHEAVERLRRRATDPETQRRLVEHLADMRAESRGQLTPAVINEWIGMGYPRSCLVQSEMRLANAEPEHRVYLLQSLPTIALKAEDPAKAESFARELLSIPDLAERSGEGVYCANYALGVLALKRDDVAAAKQYMLEAARTSGSLRLGLVGPETWLAKELLARGEREAVLEYLERCRSFWTRQDGAIDRWQNAIRGGGVPDFRPRRL